MKTLISRLLLALVAVVLLSQCIALDDPYYGGGYGSSYSSYGGGYAGGGGYYGSAPSYYGSPGYSSGLYGRSAYCPRCHHNPCTCSVYSRPVARVCTRCGYNPCRCSYLSRSYDDHDHDHSSHSSSSSSQRTNEKGQKLYRYGSSARGAPEGNHTKEWYKQRGYELDKLKPSR